MKILVTGHEGFIGQNMMKWLANQGHEVEGYEWNEGVLPNIEGFDWVVHLGAISSTTERDVEKIMTQNYEFSYRLLMLCNQHKVNMQYASSASVYGDAEPDTELGYSEECPVAPKSPYAWSKYLFDRLVLKSLDQLSIKVQGFRYFNVYGPGEDHKGEQASLWHKWNKGSGPFDIFEGSEEIKRDFIHIDDVCHLQYMTMLLQSPSGIYNVGTGRPVAIGRIAAVYEHLKGKKFNVVPMPDKLKSQYQYYTCANNLKIIKEVMAHAFKQIDV